MANRLDIVTVGVEDEGTVVVLVIPAEPRRAVVGATGREPRRVERVDGRAVVAGECDMRSRPVRLSLMEPEHGAAFDAEAGHAVIRPLHHDRPAERCERALVERPARGVLPHVHADVVEHQTLRARTAVPYAQISVQILPSSDVSKRNAMTAFAPFASASSIKRFVASSRPAASIFVMPFNS